MPDENIEVVREAWDAWPAVWEDWEAGVDDILEAQDGRVVVLTWQRGKGKRSEVPMEMDDDRAEALAAVGLHR